MAGGHWEIGFLVSSITGVTYTTVAVLLAVALTKSGQWKGNPLAVGTMAIFFTCGIGHVIHSIQMAYPWFLGSEVGPAARLHYGEWHLWVADGLTAAAGTWYLVSRRAFPHLVSGTAMYENVRRQQRRAVELHDNVVQGLAKAKWKLDLGDKEGALGDLRKTLASAATLETEIAETKKATEDA